MAVDRDAHAFWLKLLQFPASPSECYRHRVVPILVLLLIIGIAWFLISRSRELFVISVRNGRLTVVRGSVPQGLLGSFRDALDDSHTGKIRASRTSTGARLTASGNIPAGREQRLRNILGLYPMSKLSARPVDKRQAATDVANAYWWLRLFRRR